MIENESDMLSHLQSNKNISAQMKTITKKRFVCYLLLTLVMILVVLLLQWLFNGGLRINSASGEKAPINIIKVQPYDGELVFAASNCCVYLDFRAGNGMGESPTDRVNLYFDGFNITQHTDSLITSNIPPSGGLLCYNPGFQFLNGWHTAKITYTDATGAFFSYLWRFQVIDK